MDTQNANNGEKKMLTLQEACNYTGLTKSTLYKLTSSKSIPHYKPGGKMIFFDRSELEDWLRSNRVEVEDQK